MRILIAIAITILIFTPSVAAQTPSDLPQVQTSGLFAEQCDTAHYARLILPERKVWIDLPLLLSLQYEPGVWEGYDSPTPFGRPSYPEGEREAYIELYTPCGVMLSQVWENPDHSFTLFAYRTLILWDQDGQPCQPGDGSVRCGYHDFAWGHLSVEEWHRVLMGTLTKER